MKQRADQAHVSDKLVCNELSSVIVSPSKHGLLLYAINSFKHIKWRTFVHKPENK
jgi:hypothetical protein